uniref:Amino acid permease/ SLC12A domain-containing protein n=1 Tax=Romanomermis culicivorax TaxID=13658 RepID=A0A915I0V1_ROMCU
MISRSLGPEFGGSVGIVFSLANIMAGAMNVVGFAETCRDLMRDHKTKIIDADTNDIRIIGCAVLLLLACIVLVGVDFEIKAQVVLLVVLTAALVNYAVGTFLTPTLVQRSK